jgi:putative tricarboxylic transport membrane protein
MPTKEDLQAMVPAILRGTIAGFDPRHPAGRRRDARVLRRLHAGEEDREGRRTLRQGRDRRRGGPESANNAGAQTSFIPLLTLGIPPNAVMALMVGAMTITTSSRARRS